MRQIEAYIGSSSPLVGPYVRVNVYVCDKLEWGRDFSRQEGLEELESWLRSYEGYEDVSASDLSNVREQINALATALGVSQSLSYVDRLH
jgi:hypothetical protein